MKNLLITGSNGFLGKSLLPKLINCYSVSVIVKKIPEKKNSKVRYIVADLFNEEKIEKILKLRRFNYLIHLAWDAKPKFFWSSKNNFKFLHASKNLYNNFCINGGKYAILIGSAAECNLKSNIIKESENEKVLFKSRYEISKYLLMKNVQKISDIFNIKYAWLRIFWTYGPNQPRGKLISDFEYSINKKRNFVIKNKSDSVNLMHVEDIAEAIFKLFTNKSTGLINVASKNSYKVYELFLNNYTKNLRNIIVFKTNKQTYSFKKIIINKLKKVSFYEKNSIIGYINSKIK